MYIPGFPFRLQMERQICRCVNIIVCQSNTSSSRFTTVCFATTQNNDGFGIRKPKISTNYKKFKKRATFNTGSDVKKQHSQSEMRIIPIYYLSQSGKRWLEIRGEKHFVLFLVYHCWATILQF
jgi:hypothetical protein